MKLVTPIELAELKRRFDGVVTEATALTDAELEKLHEGLHYLERYFRATGGESSLVFRLATDLEAIERIILARKKH